MSRSPTHRHTTIELYFLALQSLPTMAQNKPKHVVIVGGSLAGLMHGLYLKRQGVAVTILEQDPNAGGRKSHNAGIAFGPAVAEVLARYDDTRVQSYIPAVGTRIAFRTFKDLKHLKESRNETSWEMLYYILRANFDGLTSDIVPVPPTSRPGDGKSEYLVGRKVHELTFSPKPNGDTKGAVGSGDVTVRYISTASSEADGDVPGVQEGIINAGLVIAADGRYSTIRGFVNPNTQAKTEYAGYVAWRGTILETEVSSETAEYFENKTSLNFIKDSYLVVYLIPSKTGSLAPGTRLINWVWYYNFVEGSCELSQVLTDVHGHLHSATVPAGLVRHEIWQKYLSSSIDNMSAPYAEILSKTKAQDLFVTKITDGLSDKAVFYNGAVVLVGDALAAFRPHLAVGTEQAAKHCLDFAKVWEGRMTLAEWERSALANGKKLYLTSRVLGMFGCSRWLEFVETLLQVVLFLIRFRLKRLRGKL